MTEQRTKAAALADEAGGGMTWTDFGWGAEDTENCYFTARVHSDWYTASVLVEASRGRLQNYYNDIACLLKFERDTASFINENGNFEVNLILGRRGNVTAEGILIKSMAEEERLEYSFETELASVERFFDQISALLRQV